MTRRSRSTLPKSTPFTPNCCECRVDRKTVPRKVRTRQPRIPRGESRWPPRPGRCRQALLGSSPLPLNEWNKGSGLSERVDKSDERVSSGRPSEEPARGRSIPRRDPDEPDDGDDDSDDSGHSSDSDFLESLQWKVMTLQVRKEGIRLGSTLTL